MFSMIRPSRSPWRSSRRRRNPICVPLADAAANSTRFCGYAVGAAFTAVALTALAIASQTETASERLRRIFAMNESSAIARMPPRVAQLETETQRLAAQVRALITDRDRLAGRIALLESSIDDMTGAIKKQAVATATALAARVPPPTPGAPATASPAPSNPPAANVAIAATETLASAALPAPKADRAPPQAIPLPPARIATVSITGPDPPAAKQDDFGLDLGGGATIDAVRQRWSTVKANFGPLLSGMHPLAAHDQRPGAPGYRLVVGPLPNSVAAAGLCAHFSAARTACRAVKFDGEQIAQQ